MSDNRRQKRQTKLRKIAKAQKIVEAKLRRDVLAYENVSARTAATASVERIQQIMKYGKRRRTVTINHDRPMVGTLELLMLDTLFKE